MELRLSRAEYWLLESVVTHNLPLHFLLAADLEEGLNKPGHGLPESRLLDVLEGLVQHGWIEVTAGGSEEHGWAPDKVQLLEALRQPVGKRTERMLFYQLTTSGGAAWESFAAPDWGRFMDQGWDIVEGCGELTGVSDKLMRRFLSLAHHLGYLVREGSEKWEVARPFRATYWKELPSGHRVRFEFRHDDDQVLRSDRIPHIVMFLQDCWYRWR